MRERESIELAAEGEKERAYAPPTTTGCAPIEDPAYYTLATVAGWFVKGCRQLVHTAG